MAGPLPLGVCWEPVGSSLGACRAPRGPSRRLQRSFRTALGCHWAQRVLFGDRLVWHARSWASAVDFEAASRRCLLCRYVQIHLKPMVFDVFIVLQGHAGMSPRCSWGAAWHLRSVTGLSLPDPGTPEGSLEESLGVHRGLLGGPWGVPCARLAVLDCLQ